MTYRLVEDDRPAVVWLNYNKLDYRNIDPYTPMGPNLVGEHLWPVEIDVSGEKDRLGFSFREPYQITQVNGE